MLWDVVRHVYVRLKRISKPDDVPCSNCRTLCKWILRQELPFELNAFPYTSFKKLEQTDCPLCKIFCRVLEDDGAKLGYSYVGHESVRPYCVWSVSQLPGDRGQICISTSCPERHNVLLRARLGRPPDPASSTMATHSGRASFPEIKDWLQSCEEHYTRVALSRAGRSVMHLVDLHQECIRPMEVAGNYGVNLRYVALSYVWGGCQQLQLTKARYSELLSPRSLTRLKEEIPRTIWDAMLVALELGFGYLWVDALCITQDSEEEKAEQIGRMDIIYSQAALTIVNAAGEDANSTLPGISHAGRCQYSHPCLAQFNPRDCDPDRANCYEEDYRLWITPAHPGDVTTDEAICDSKWYSRGWTFQELVLSSRLLIFTKRYVIFHCAEQTAAEDELSGGALKRFEGARFAGVGKLHDYWRLQASHLEPGSTTTLGHRDMMKIYGELASQYAIRNFTKDEDALLAFGGILSSLEPSFGNFFWGLPRKNFAQFLHWNIRSSSNARVQRRGSRLFPSWTWIAWQTPLYFHDFCGMLGKYVCCHMVEDTAPLRLTVVHETCHCSDRAGEMHFQVEQALARLGSARPPGMIAFWTEELCLTIKDERISAVEMGRPEGEEVRAKYNAYAGERYLCEVDLSDDDGISSGSQVKFVRITRHPKDINAMMLRDEGPISYRIGFTHDRDTWEHGIHLRQWRKAKPTPRLVILA